MKTNSILVVVLLVLLVVVVAGLIYFYRGNTKNGAVEKECTIDSDCIPDTCCHPTACVKQYPRVCNVFCTQDCSGPLDCGAGHCGCVNGKCSIVPGPTR